MSKIERLVKAYKDYISVPWRTNAADPQRLCFCVYDQRDERTLRAKLGEFEIATQHAGHPWIAYDLTGTFPQWLLSTGYAEGYFANPRFISRAIRTYQDFIHDDFEAYVKEQGAQADHVVCVYGIGTLFGFLSVKELVECLVRHVPGRLVVLFPGSYADNNYRLLDAHDGWNYLATAITAEG